MQTAYKIVRCLEFDSQSPEAFKTLSSEPGSPEDAFYQKFTNDPLTYAKVSIISAIISKHVEDMLDL